MKTIYFIWKDPSCNGINPKWEKITGQKFYFLVRSPEGKGRFFIKLDGTDKNGDDRRIVIEATKNEYVKWRKEKDHSDYVQEQQQNSGFQFVSYQYLDSEDALLNEASLEDTGINIEADYIESDEKAALKKALSQLSEDEYHMIGYFFLSGNKGTVRGYADITGIPVMTVQNRKKALLKKIKELIEG
jgi:DNA-directed RNA polymerase specialized sigma subunit